MSPAAWVALTIAGGAGSYARFALDRLVVARTHERLPYGILVVNLLGAFLLGLLTSWHSPREWLWIAEVGFVGTFTTFSTWMLDTHRLALDGRWRAATANVVVSLVLGVALAALGRALGGIL